MRVRRTRQKSFGLAFVLLPLLPPRSGLTHPFRTEVQNISGWGNVSDWWVPRPEFPPTSSQHTSCFSTGAGDLTYEPQFVQNLTSRLSASTILLSSGPAAVRMLPNTSTATALACHLPKEHRRYLVRGFRFSVETWRMGLTRSDGLMCFLISSIPSSPHSHII